MKILLVSPFTDISGSAIRFWNMAHQFSLMGHEVIYVERSANKPQPPVYPNIKYYTSPKLNNLFIDILVSLIFNTFILLKHINVNIVYALKPAPNNCIPALFSKILGKKIFLDIDDLDYGYFKGGIKLKISKFFFNFFPKFFKVVTCHTKSLEDYIKNELKIPTKKVHFLKQGISDDFLNYHPSLNQEISPRSIVYVASLGITSDLDACFTMFVSLSKKYPDLTIKIIGDGVRKNEFKELAKKSNIHNNIQFLGRIPHDKLPEIIYSSNIGINYMHSSFTNDCRAILKIREYLALGLQVVCNNSGDASAFKDYISINENIESMERSIDSMLQKNEAIRNIRGQKFIKDNFKWENIILSFQNKFITNEINK